MRKIQIHILTPGDHFSPRTGSAVATVVDGLSVHTTPRPIVLVATGTYEERYASADVLEYEMTRSPHEAPRWVRALDVGMGRVGLPRTWARAVYKQPLHDQTSWPSGYVIAHNAPMVVRLVDEKHSPVLYAHNNLLEHYNTREATASLRPAHRIVCVSNYTAERIAAKVPSLAERVRVVHNGVDLEIFNGPRSSPTTGHLRVGYVGRVVPAKGVHLVIEALARLGRSDIDLTIIGSSGFSAEGPLTPYETGLRRAAASVPGRVSFVPFQPRAALPALYLELDVLVVPSIEPEAFTLTIVEGMAAGTAMVVSDIGGTAEAAGGAALLVPPNNVEQIAQALDALLTSSTLVADLQRQGRQRAAQRTWRHSARDLEVALQ